MRICSPQLGLAPGANLGGAVYDRELLRAMVKQGVAVDVLLPEGERVEADVGWQIIRTPRHRRSYYEYNWIFLNALRRHWKTRPADVLRVHSPYSVGPGALAFARAVGVPLALHYLHRERRRLWTFIDYVTLRQYDLIVTISEATRRDLAAAGVPDATMIVAYPGVDESYTPSVRVSAGAPLLAVYVGGLIARKNLSLALRGVALARRRGVEIRFVLAGAGDLEHELRREAAALGIAESVQFRGIVSHEEKLELLRQADLFLFPSRLEGFGMAAAEALACGTPVIGLSTTSTAEIVQHGRTGLLLEDPDDAHAMADAIERLAMAPGRRLEMGQRAARDVRARFSWRASADAVVRAYGAILEARRAI